MQTLSKVKEYIQTKVLLDKEAKVVVGVSGGADSIALLDILIHLGYNCIAAHCNFHLRGEESDRDYRFVKKICQERKIEFIYTDFDTYKYMTENSVSLEMAARELRYEWFEKIRVELNANKIAVAHHQDDSVETVLINLIRGTGIKGLTGIPSMNGNIVRPLLCLYRENIIQYLSENNLEFVEDSTNKEDVYIRNKIRLNIIPLLETINPSVKQSIYKTSENLLSVEKIYEANVDKIKNEIFVNNTINIPLLLKENEPKTILFEILHPYGFNSENIVSIFNTLTNQSGKQFYSKDYILIKDRDLLILEEISLKDENVYHIRKDDTNINNPIRLKIEKLNSREEFLEYKKNSNTIFLDQDRLTYPLTIRHWQNGDKFVPFGMKGSKKLSDYFSDQKNQPS